MDFLELAKARYSVRSFKPSQITDGELERILEAGRVSPSACNRQPFKVYVVKSEEKLKALKEVCICTFDAPQILVICYDKNQAWQNRLDEGYHSGETDAAIFCTHMMLEAFELGIGSCWVGYFNSDAVKEALGLESRLTVSAIMPIGYPADDAVPARGHLSIKDKNETVEII
ncbi:MAG: nitroreductase family protein [Clostridia bacterium]|nr:nitroreductase family protein [Clostridia bacterium]MBR2327845.1 nitroreductase family protein [Clostridia bacterium]